MADKIIKAGLYLARARCDKLHIVQFEVLDPKTFKKDTFEAIQYLTRLWVLWRVPKAAKFELALTDDRGYLQPCDAQATPDATNATQYLQIDAPYEFYFVRHPSRRVAARILDEINDGSPDFGDPLTLKLVKSNTGTDADGFECDEALLLVPESTSSFWPKGSALYKEWVLFRDMPNSACDPVRKEVRRLQLHLGAMRFLIGDSPHPYRPVEKVLGDFDIMAWNSTIKFQDYLKGGLIRTLLPAGPLFDGIDHPRTPLYDKTFPFEPNPKATLALDCDESILYIEKQTVLEPYPKVEILAEDRGVVTDLTGRHLAKWLERDGRKPDFVVVCFDPPHTDWTHEQLVARVRGFSQELAEVGFAPANAKGERQLGLLLSSTFRDIRVYVRTGGGAMDSSLHKCGAAFDLWMGATISGASQDDPNVTNYYPLYYTREDTLTWKVWGEVNKTDLEASGNTKILKRDSLLSITPFKYDPLSPTGGGESVVASPGRVYIDISSIANFYGIFNIAPHPHGWTGGDDHTYPIDGKRPAFAELMKRLKEQFFKENIKSTDVFIVNELTADPIKLSGKAMISEYGFWALWEDRFGSLFPRPEVTIATPAQVKQLVGIGATYGNRRFIVTEIASGITKDDFAIPLAWMTTPPSLPFNVEPKIQVPSNPKKWVRYQTFFCPAFKGNPTHLEWWHFQVRKIGDRDLGLGAGFKWFDLVSELGITKDIIDELYDPKVLTVRAG